MKTDWSFILDELADTIIYEIEGSLLNHDSSLSKEFDQLPNDVVYEIREYWKLIILEKLQTALPFPPTEEMSNDYIDPTAE